MPVIQTVRMGLVCEHLDEAAVSDPATAAFMDHA